jgi:hypothetical protein
VVPESNKTVLSQLNPGMSYAVRVAARNSAGIGPFTEFALATTLLVDLTAPQNVRVGRGTRQDEIRLLWDAPLGEPSKHGYKVFYSPNPSLSIFKWSSKIVPVDDSVGSLPYVPHTVLSGLEQDTMYGLRVSAREDSEGTSLGPLSRLVLHRVGPALYDNFDLRPIKVEASYVIFQWHNPSGIVVTKYVLRYYNLKDPNADQDVIPMGGNATLCLVAGLQSFAQYHFNMTVFHLNEIGEETSNLSLKFTLFTKATLPDDRCAVAGLAGQVWPGADRDATPLGDHRPHRRLPGHRGGADRPRTKGHRPPEQ